MGLSSIFKRKNEPAPVAEPVDEVQRARTRARQRLIGAVVLLAIGVIGFPMVFETQPRPIPVDLPIEIPRKDGLPPLAAPPARQPASMGTSASPAGRAEAGRSPPASGEDVITESREDAFREAAPAAGGSAPSAAAASRPAAPRLASARPEARADGKPVTRPEPRPSAPAAADDGARARALLEGRSGAPAAGPQAPVSPAAPTATATVASIESSRYIVQVGAYADAGAAQETRQRIERLGLKTYTQVASTPAGPRIRVRLGPFPSRDEADKALAKARGAGLSAVVLGL